VAHTTTDVCVCVCVCVRERERERASLLSVVTGHEFKKSRTSRGKGNRSLEMPVEHNMELAMTTWYCLVKK
jgi:hypothetical protein